MRTEQFEVATLAMGLEPVEVRLRNNHVEWFICRGRKELGAAIVVFDKEGKALVLPRFDWPEEVSDIDIRYYRDPEGPATAVIINSLRAIRDSCLDLRFESSHTND